LLGNFRRRRYPKRVSELGTALALLKLTVAAAHKKPRTSSFPLLHGMLRANAETIEGPRPCDWFDVFVDDQSNLVVLLMDVIGSAESGDDFPELLFRETRTALSRHDPLHTVISGLEMQLATHPGTEAGLSILRISQRDAKVELLNAGMPAIASAGPGGRLDLYPALSNPVGRRVGEVHPYELVPLVWGGTWLTVSDGMIGGSLDSDPIAALCVKLALADQGLSLAAASSERLYDALLAQLSAGRFVRDDATAVIIGADPDARFQSGIV
jgi:hypothetical protein